MDEAMRRFTVAKRSDDTTNNTKNLEKPLA